MEKPRILDDNRSFHETQSFKSERAYITAGKPLEGKIDINPRGNFNDIFYFFEFSSDDSF